MRAGSWDIRLRTTPNTLTWKAFSITRRGENRSNDRKRRIKALGPWDHLFEVDDGLYTIPRELWPYKKNQISYQHYLARTLFVKRLPYPIDLTHITVYTLVRFPKTPLTKLLDNENTRSYSRNEWLFKGMLTSIRPLTDDAIFNRIRATALFAENPWMLNDIYPTLLLNHAIRTRQVVHEPSVLQQLFVHYSYSREFEGSDVFVWGTGENYNQNRHHFYKVRIKAFIDNDASLQGETKDGVTIRGPEALSEAPDVPVFVCSAHRETIVRQIRESPFRRGLII